MYYNVINTVQLHANTQNYTNIRKHTYRHLAKEIRENTLTTPTNFPPTYIYTCIHITSEPTLPKPKNKKNHERYIHIFLLYVWNYVYFL